MHVHTEPACDGFVLQAGGEQPEQFPLVRGEGAAGAAEGGGARPQGLEQRQGGPVQQAVAEHQGRCVVSFVVAGRRGQQAGTPVHEDQGGGQALSDAGLEAESGEGDELLRPVGEVGATPVGDGPYGDAARQEAADAVRAGLPGAVGRAGAAGHPGGPRRAVEDQDLRLGGFEHGVEADAYRFGAGEYLDAGRGPWGSRGLRGKPVGQPVGVGAQGLQVGRLLVQEGLAALDEYVQYGGRVGGRVDHRPAVVLRAGRSPVVRVGFDHAGDFDRLHRDPTSVHGHF